MRVTITKKIVAGSLVAGTLTLSSVLPALAWEGYPHLQAVRHHGFPAGLHHQRFSEFVQTLTPDEQQVLESHHQEMVEQHLEHLAEVTGLSQAEIQTRLETGESPRDIIESQGLDLNEVSQDMRGYFRQHRQEFKDELKEINPSLWGKLQSWMQQMHQQLRVRRSP